MPLIAVPNTFVPNTLIKSADVNADLAAIVTAFNASAVLTDVAKAILVRHTMSAGLAVSAGSTDVQALTATTGVFSGNVQTPTVLATSTSALATNQATLGLLGGATDTKLQNAANNATNLQVADAGDVTVSRGRLLIGAAASKVVPGATSLSVRNTADSADNLLVADIGDVTVRRDLIVTRNLSVTGTLSAIGTVVAAAQATDLSQTTVTPAATSLVIPVGASQVWRIDFDVALGCNNTGGTALSITAPAGATGSAKIIGTTTGSGVTATPGNSALAALGNFVTFNTAGVGYYVRVSVYLVTAGTPGNVTMLYNAVVGGQTATFYTGGTVLATRIS